MWYITVCRTALTVPSVPYKHTVLESGIYIQYRPPATNIGKVV